VGTRIPADRYPSDAQVVRRYSGQAMNDLGRDARESKNVPAQKRRKDAGTECQKALDEALDVGLEDTFPGSDPVAVTQPVGHGCPKDEG
jgi:hypothetical protein